MTVHDMLAEGRLADAVALQEAAVGAAPADPGARRLLIDLLAFAGRLDDALEHLDRIDTDEPLGRKSPAACTACSAASGCARSKGATRPSPRTRRRNTPPAAGSR